MSATLRILVLALALAGFAAAGAAAQESKPAPPPEQKAKDDESKPKEPKAREYSYLYDLLDHSLFRPLTRVFDPGLWVRKVSNQPRQAANVDENDQVRLPSTWWQPRLGYRAVTVEQMLKGPGSGKGPAPGKWKVTKGKSQGVTPGFQMRDSENQLWFVKFDLPTFPELTTSADVIGTYLYWAAGYNVPENVIAYFRPESLIIDEKATSYDRHGNKVKLTRELLDEMFAGLYRQRDGRFRVVASKALKGKPLGPFKFYGRRKDDPEDLIPHELRRELRGLWVINAWANHADSRGPNSQDMWVTENGRSFVRHNLLDFSGILGSGGLKARSQVTGTEYYIDFNVMMREAVSLGFIPFDWEDVVDPHIPSIGMIEAESFDPTIWKPDYPNPAFDERTVRDIRWGARILAAFTDEHIRAAVSVPTYSDPRAADYLVQTLIKRRDKLVNYWLGPESGQLTTAP